MTQFDLSDDTVVVVIGSGAGGGTLANELAQKGIKTVCLEAGQRLDYVDDFENDEVKMFGKLTWLDKRTATGSWNRAGTPLPAWILKTVGGTSVHWAGASLRIRDHEFKALDTYGNIDGANLANWPISEAELAPYYDLAEQKIGVTGTHGIPNLPENNNYKVLKEGAHRIGYTEISNDRMGINAEYRDGRAGCQQLGFCFFGCKMGAKWSTLYSEIPKAEETGNFELRPGSHVQRIEHGADGRVSGVIYVDSDGIEVRQSARLVAVAGNAIETPRILLNSASNLFPDGLGNGSGHLGKNYMRHTFGFVFGTFPQPVNMYRGTTGAGNISDENGNDPSRGFVGGYYIQLMAHHPVGMARAIQAERGYGAALTSAMEHYDKMAGLLIVGEDMPVESNRVSLNPDAVDQFGLPVANVHYDDHPNNDLMRDHALEQGSKIYEAMGATDILKAGPPPATHNLGTARMSQDADKGFVNGWGQSHEISNLFVSDGSQFTTSSAENPTLTIVSLAIRQADYIERQMSAGLL